MKNTPLSRRQFLALTSGTAGAIAIPTIIPASVLGQGAPAPSERINIGFIGVGEQGNGVLGGALGLPECRVVAVADVKESARTTTCDRINAHYKNKDCKAYADFREILARKDIDAVTVATPDHWHVFIGVAACQAGKDLYVEKPLGLTLEEDQAMRAAVQKHERIFQFGTQQRSSSNFRRACEMVRSGVIGKLKHIDVWCMGSVPGGPTDPVPVPPDINYEFWVGPGPFKPYTEMRTHAHWQKKTWWYESEYALGFIAGWGVHPLDIAYWGAGELAQCNLEVQGRGEIPKQGACNTATDWDVDFSYASGLTMKFKASPITLNGGPSKIPPEFKQKYGVGGAHVADHGTAFIGERGWVHVHRGGLSTNPEDLQETRSDQLQVQLYRSTHHYRNFLECIRSRKETICPVEDAVQTDLLCHLSDQAIRRGRKLSWDFKSEKFVNDDEANRKLGSRPIRRPWKLAA